MERYGPPQLLHASRDILERTLIATLGFVGDTTADPRCNTILNIASYNMPQSNFRPNGNTPAALSRSCGSRPSAQMCVCVCRFYGRVCLSHLMTEPDFERIASRTLNTQQWSKMRDAVEMIRVKVHDVLYVCSALYSTYTSHTHESDTHFLEYPVS